MSVHVLSWVLRNSEATLGKRLVLLVLADHAKEDGSGSWPSVNTIAREARMSPRAVQYALRELEAAGEIEQTGVSKQGTTLWRVTMQFPQPRLGAQDLQGANTAGGRKIVQRGDETVAPEPSVQQPSKDKPPHAPSEHAPPLGGPDLKLVEPDPYAKIANYLSEKVRSKAVTVKSSSWCRPTETWRKAAQLMVEQDGVPIEQLYQGIDWVMRHTYWSDRIKSFPRLRQEWCEIEKDAKRQSAGRQRGGGSDFEQRQSERLARIQRGE